MKWITIFFVIFSPFLLVSQIHGQIPEDYTYKIPPNCVNNFLIISNKDVPYVFYSNIGTEFKTKIKRFIDNKWIDFGGGEALSGGMSQYDFFRPAIKINDTGDLFVFCQNYFADYSFYLRKITSEEYENIYEFGNSFLTISIQDFQMNNDEFFVLANLNSPNYFYGRTGLQILKYSKGNLQTIGVTGGRNNDLAGTLLNENKYTSYFNGPTPKIYVSNDSVVNVMVTSTNFSPPFSYEIRILKYKRPNNFFPQSNNPWSLISAFEVPEMSSVLINEFDKNGVPYFLCRNYLPIQHNSEVPIKYTLYKYLNGSWQSFPSLIPEPDFNSSSGYRLFFDSKNNPNLIFTGGQKFALQRWNYSQDKWILINEVSSSYEVYPYGYYLNKEDTLFFSVKAKFEQIGVPNTKAIFYKATNTLPGQEQHFVEVWNAEK